MYLGLAPSSRGSVTVTGPICSSHNSALQAAPRRPLRKLGQRRRGWSALLTAERKPFPKYTTSLSIRLNFTPRALLQPSSTPDPPVPTLPALLRVQTEGLSGFGRTLRHFVAAADSGKTQSKSRSCLPLFVARTSPPQQALQAHRAQRPSLPGAALSFLSALTGH